MRRWHPMLSWMALCSLLVGTILLGPAASADERNMTPILEAKMRWWKPRPINNQTPSDALRARDMNIEGKFGYRGTFSSITLTIRRIRGQEFAIELEYSNCTSYTRFQRKGRYADGILLLDRPLYAENPYLRFYAVRARGKDYLLPDALVADFEKALQPGRTDLAEKNSEPQIGYPRLLEEK